MLFKSDKEGKPSSDDDRKKRRARRMMQVYCESAHPAPRLKREVLTPLCLSVRKEAGPSPTSPLTKLHALSFAPTSPTSHHIGSFHNLSDDDDDDSSSDDETYGDLKEPRVEQATKAIMPPNLGYRRGRLMEMNRRDQPAQVEPEPRRVHRAREIARPPGLDRRDSAIEKKELTDSAKTAERWLKRQKRLSERAKERSRN